MARRVRAGDLNRAGWRPCGDALTGDDPRLTQGSTTTPPPLMCVQDWPVEAACALGYCGWQGDELETVGEVEEFFARMCFEADQRLGEPAALPLVPQLVRRHAPRRDAARTARRSRTGPRRAPPDRTRPPNESSTPATTTARRMRSDFMLESIRILTLTRRCVMIATCRHCSKSKVNRPRGLVLELLLHPRREGAVPVHEQVRPPRRRQLHRQRPAAGRPHHGRAGHAGEARGARTASAKLKQAIFHPADARYEGDPRPLEFLKRRSA